VGYLKIISCIILRKDGIEMICRKCKTEIDHLNYDEDIIETGHCYLSSNKADLDYKAQDVSRVKIDYYCPKCGKVLFKYEDRAIKFLKKDTHEKR
jgi:Zn finger protein HypA/HybF involved in hydrogenase expression